MYARTGLVVLASILGTTVAAMAGCSSNDDDSASGASAEVTGDVLPNGKGVHNLMNGPSRAAKERDTFSVVAGADTIWVSAPGSIHRATPDFRAIVDDVAYVPELAVADKSGLYWVDSKAGQLLRADLDGANIAKIDSWYWNPSIEKQLLLDNGKLLWRSQSFTSSTNALWETPTPTGSATIKTYACADAERDGTIYCWKGKKHVDAIDVATAKTTASSADGAAPISAFAAGEKKSVVYATLLPKSETAPAAVELLDVTNGQTKRLVAGQGITWEDGIRAVATFGNTAFFTHGNEIYSVSRTAPAAPKLVTQIGGAGPGSILYVDTVVASATQLFVHLVVRSANADLPGATARESVVMIDLAEAGAPTAPTTDAGDAGDAAPKTDAGAASDAGSIFDPVDAGSDASADASTGASTKDSGSTGTTAPPTTQPDQQGDPGDTGDNQPKTLPKKESSSNGGCQSSPAGTREASGFLFLAIVAGLFVSRSRQRRVRSS